jgi:hypothetical protein
MLHTHDLTFVIVNIDRYIIIDLFNLSIEVFA